MNEAAQRNQNILQRAAAIAAEIFAPLIPAIITGGLILGFRNCIDQLYLFENGTKTLVEMSQFWAGMDQFLWLIGEAVFHMGIPVGICWSVVRKMGGTPILGIILGLTLVSGQLLNAYAVATTPVDRTTFCVTAAIRSAPTTRGSRRPIGNARSGAVPGSGSRAWANGICICTM